MGPTFFGLNKNPFSTLPRGADVFIGPQAADLVNALRTALGPGDAVAVINGPTGVGKTTLTNYALDVLFRKRKTVRLGRAPLQAENVLEALLIVLGVTNRPVDRERRFHILRDALQQYEAAGLNVIILVEDALAAGAEVLAELAALTAGTAGKSSGAKMVLMGGDSLPDLLDSPALADLHERIALQHTINALSAAETHGYLRHCFRNVGGDFNELFAADCDGLLHRICDGNPRAVKRLTEVALITADKLNLKKISARYIAEIAVQIYDPAIHDFKFPAADRKQNTVDAHPSPESPDATGTTPWRPATAGGSATIEAAIAKAASLEDLDDAMAETLFGTEIELVAAQVSGNN